ncbi:MAG: OadG family protein [Lachnospiraceae bacterium]|nr:OadG family protein [Lachnospiraceae bacterium]
MKRRLSAVLLALGLSVSVLSMGVYAEEAETKATEQATEATTDAAAEEIKELESDAAEVESEVAEAESEVAETEALSQEEQLKQAMAQYLTEIAGYTDEQLEQMKASDNASTALIAANWSSVKEELGNFVEIESVESGLSEDGYTMTITCKAKYDKLDDNTDVTVVYEANQKDQSVSFSWEIDYPMSKLIERAALNTVMGLGIVFVTLLFLSWLIGKLHIIPDMIEKKAKENEPVAPAAPVTFAAPEVEEEEEDLTDDLELVAVITAAIAASENTSSDGFVVRSIKKANKRNWQRA